MTTSPTEPDSESPPFRVGVTGHRPDQLAPTVLSAVQSTLHKVLCELRELFPGRIELVTSLAEGTDRIAATQAVHLGYQLSCPLPFTRKEYEADFGDKGSLAEFRRLLSQASKVEELPGSRATHASDQHAYSAAGRRVVEQADVLVAVWNGKRARGTGGTAEIVESASARGIPIIWVRIETATQIQIIEPATPRNESVVKTLIDAVHEFA